MILTSVAGPPLWVGSEQILGVLMKVHVVNDWLLIAAYLPALAVAIDSPLLRPFRRAPGVLIPVVIGVAGAVLATARPDLFLLGFTHDAPSRFGTPHAAVIGGLWTVAWSLLTLSYTYGFIATIVAWRRAETPLARRRAGVFSWAFGTRDLFWGGCFLCVSLFINEASIEVLYPVIQLAAWALFAYVLLTAYGIATVHLFDIELRLKWTLQRGTVAAAFIAVFFVVSEGAATVLSGSLGTLAGLLVTGLLVFALVPLQRSAERLAEAALPSVQDTPEYRTFRKHQIYGEAVVEARRDGALTPAGRVALNQLRASLDLSESEVSGLEAGLGVVA